MLKANPIQAQNVADALSNGLTYKSHGKVIDFNEARNVLKLNVEKIDENSELWQLIWELYARSLHFLHRQPSNAKLFESETVSLNMSISVVGVPQKPPSGEQQNQ
jgi:hypothetical protein